MIKATGELSNWFVWDTSRNIVNTMSTTLWPSSTQTDYTDATYSIDSVSNGFKIRSVGQYAGLNNSGSAYLYLAFAESPFGLNNRAR
jgi:hypothetical protein